MLGLGAIGLVAIGLAAALAPGGSLGTVRTILGCAALLVVPGWLVGRLVDDEGDALVRVVGGGVATIAACALLGFLAAELGLRVGVGVYAVVLAVIVVAAAVLGLVGPPRPSAHLGALAAAGLLGVAALGGAFVTHLALPATPVEAAFSLEASTAIATPRSVTVTVTVSRVRSSGPTALTLEVDGVTRSTSVAPDETSVRLVTPLGPHAARCPALVTVSAPNGAFLSPPVICVGW